MIEQILSYRTLFLNICAITSYAFLSALNKSLHAMLVKICTSRGDPLSLLPLLKCTTMTSFGLHKHSTSVNEYQWV